MAYQTSIARLTKAKKQNMRQGTGCTQHAGRKRDRLPTINCKRKEI